MTKVFKIKLNLVSSAIFAFSILFNIFCFSVSQAAVLPSIESVQVSPSSVTQGRETKISISCRATSIYGISSVVAEIFNSNGTKITAIPLYDDGLHGDGGRGDEAFAGEYTAPATLSLGKYYITVKAVDGTGVTNFKEKITYFDVVSAQTMLSAASSVVLLNENFDSYNYGYIPAGWNGDYWQVGALSYGAYHTAPYATYGTYQGSGYLATKPLSLTSGKSYKLNFWYRWDKVYANTDPGYYMRVSYNSSQGSGGTELTSFEIKEKSWRLKEISFTVPASGDYFIIFDKTGLGGGGVAIIDDVKVEELETPAISLGVVVSGSGTVSGNGITCTSDCSATFAPGVNISLTATPGANSEFVNWTGGACNGEITSVCNFVINSSVSVTANFKTVYTLSVTKTGDKSGTVVTPGGNCQGYCTYKFNPGTAVNLSLNIPADSSFTGWGGACASFGTGSTCTLTMDASKSVTASFGAMAVIFEEKFDAGASGNNCIYAGNPPVDWVGDSWRIYAGGYNTPCAVSGAWSQGTDLISKAVNLSSGGIYRLTFSYKGEAGTNYPMTVFLSTSQNLKGIDEIIPGLTINNTTWNTMSKQFVAPSTGNFYLWFSRAGFSGSGAVIIDSIKIEETSASSYALNTSVSGSGSGAISGTGINCTPSGGEGCLKKFIDGDLITLTATEGENSAFVSWSGVTGCSTGATCSFRIHSNISLRANFKTAYTLSVAKIGNLSGTIYVTPNPPGGSCQGTCSYKFDPDTLVDLTVTFGSDSVFAGWGGACADFGTQRTCSLIMDSAKSVTATFGAPVIILNENFDAGVYNNTCYNAGGLPPTGWSGDTWRIYAGGYNTACAITNGWIQGIDLVSKAVSLTLGKIYNLTFSYKGEDSTANYPMDVYLSTSQTSKGANQIVPGFAVNSTGWQTASNRFVAPSTGTFYLWFSRAGLTGAGAVIIDSVKITETTAPSYTLNAYVSGSGSGTISGSGINCGSGSTVCSKKFIDGDLVTFNAVEGTDSVFLGWSGYSGCSTGTPCSFRIHSNVSLRANFKKAYTLHIRKTGSQSGTIYISPGGASCQDNCSNIFDPNTSVTLTLSYPADSVFTGWGGACASFGTGSTCTLTMDASKSVTASFGTPAFVLDEKFDDNIDPWHGNVCIPGGVPSGWLSNSWAISSGGFNSSPCSISGPYQGGSDLISESFSLVSGNVYQLTFYYKGLENINGYYMNVYLSTSQSLRGTNEIIPGFIINGGFWRSKGVRFTAPGTGTYYLWFAKAGFGGDGLAVVDDVTVQLTTAQNSTLNVVVAGAGMVSGSNINCGSQCTNSYPSGTRVTLTASPIAGSSFINWTGGACNGQTTSPCDFFINSNVTITANFTGQSPVNQAPIIYSIADSPDPVTVGNIIGFGAVWSDPNSGDQTKLHVCKTNAISGQTCSGGSWCNTTAWSASSPNSCPYTTLSSDVGTKSYYIFVCDDDNACSAAGNSGTFTVNAGDSSTGVLQSIGVGSPSCGIGWNHSMGYLFHPTQNGQITKLCGYFSGTKWVRLYNDSYSLLASAQVTSSNTWSCTSITPVSAPANQYYYVVAELAGSGGCYNISFALPQTSQAVVISSTVSQSPSGTFNSSHSESAGAMYGMADVVFSPGGVTNQAPTISSITANPNPVTIGGITTFAATWSDPNTGDKTKLHVCKTSVISSAQACSGGSWCDTTSFSANSPISCPTQLADVGTANYHAFVCDDDNACSAASSGTFTVNPVVVSPAVTTSATISITTSGATFPGEITATGGATITTRGFKYGLTQTDTWDSSVSGSFGTGIYTMAITGLTENTTYWFRAYAVNSVGTGYGAWTSFVTSQIPNQPPTIEYINDLPDPVVVGNIIGFGAIWSDPNSGDLTKLHICKTNAISGQTCSGGSWCNTTSFSASSPTSCSYTTQTGDVGTKNYYAFVCDDDNACSTASSGTFTVNSGGSWTCGNTLTDSRDNKNYATVLIGTQCWMKQGLNVGTRIGGTLNQGTSCSSIQKYCYNDTDTYCDSIGNPSYPDGGLYRWNQAMCGSTTPGVQGICPTGWHIPTDTEYKTLEMYLGMTQAQADAYEWRGTDQGTKLKPGGTSGFEGNLAGLGAGSFSERSITGLYWSSNQYNNDPSGAFARLLGSSSSMVYRGGYGILFGFPVRCVKDSTISPIISPTVTTSAASSITTSGATLNGNITATGGVSVTKRGFKYGLTQTGTWDSSESGSFNTGAYSKAITGLTANTTYWFRAYAVNSAGTGYGSWTSFTTSQIVNQAPTVEYISDSPDPVVAGNIIALGAVWSDPNSGDLTKLHICKTNAISGQTCSGGSWCDTTSFSASSPTSCSYTTQTGNIGTNNYYVFVCDDDNACSAVYPGTFTVNPNTYTLTVSKSGAGSGTVTGTSISCGTTCTASYTSGASVTLTATPDTGSTEASWSGCDSNTVNSCTISMTGNKSVTATFNTSGPIVSGQWQSCSTPTPTGHTSGDFTAGYLFSPLLNGQITHLCGVSDGTRWVKLYNDSYLLLASAQITSSGAVCTPNCTLYWACTAIPPINVNTGSSYYVAIDAGLNGYTSGYDSLPKSCNYLYIAKSFYQSPSGTFNSNHTSHTATMRGLADVVFVPTINYTLTVFKSGTGSGIITGTSISCGSTCSASYTSGTSVTLTATPATGSTFAGWSGACTGTGTCTVSMTANQSVTATFNGSYILTVFKSGTGSGTITGTGISCGSTCLASYTSGTSVTFTATQDAGSAFGNWSGCNTFSGNTCTVIMNSNNSVTATFNVVTGPLTLSSRLFPGYSFRSIYGYSDYLYGIGDTGSGPFGGADSYFIRMNKSDFSVSTGIAVGGYSEDRGNSMFIDGDNSSYYVGKTYEGGQGYGDAFILVADWNFGFWSKKTYGGTSYDVFKGVTADSNYVYVVGYTGSEGAGSSDALIVKFNKILFSGGSPTDFSLAARKVYGGTGSDEFDSVYVDSNYIYAVGKTNSEGSGGDAALIVKFNTSDLSIASRKVYGGSGSDSFASIFGDSNYLYVVGTTNSEGQGSDDALIVKFNKSDLSIAARKIYGGYSAAMGGSDTFNSVYVDGNYIYTTGNTGTETGNYFQGALIVKFNASDLSIAAKKAYVPTGGIGAAIYLNSIYGDSNYIYVSGDTGYPPEAHRSLLVKLDKNLLLSNSGTVYNSNPAGFSLRDSNLTLANSNLTLANSNLTLANSNLILANSSLSVSYSNWWSTVTSYENQ